MEFIFAYAAGLLTLINPCVLPVLPIAVASIAVPGRAGPLALAAGLVASFTIVGVLVTAAGPALGLSPEHVSRGGALLMMGFGLVLLTPRFGAAFATASSGFAGVANRQIGMAPDRGLVGTFFGGALLGAVWSPCIGPTLGGALALASQGEELGRATAIMFAFALGAATVLMALAYGGREAMSRHKESLRTLAAWSSRILGGAFFLVGAVLFLELHHPIEAALLEALPEWLQDLSVRY